MSATGRIWVIYSRYYADPVRDKLSRGVCCGTGARYAFPDVIVQQTAGHARFAWEVSSAAVLQEPAAAIQGRLTAVPERCRQLWPLGS